jgi:carbonic anhydrase
MTISTQDLFAHNRAWAAQMKAERPGFFTGLEAQQSPKYMWIGCSDSRVPANQITGLEPGQVFVHRNVGNVVVATDLNCLSTIQYAVDQLHVTDLMVVGHYGCGGVQVAMDNTRIGLADNWLRHIKDVRDRHRVLIDAALKHSQQDVLCELNVIEQVVNVAQTTVVQDAWLRKQPLTLHGWIYGLKNGLLIDLKMTVSCNDDLKAAYSKAIQAVAESNRDQTATKLLA